MRFWWENELKHKMRRQPEDISGNKYNRLTAIRLSHKVGYVHYWVFKCACGNEKAIIKSKVTSGETKSCGCYQKEVATSDSTTHGLTNHPVWRLYRDIKNRCYRKTVISYPIYGGRGVIMCDEWKNDFISFYNWCMCNGWRKGMQIDKDIKAKELGVEPLLYSPEMCQFVTPKQNCNTRRSSRNIELNGVTKTLQQWSELTGINYATIIGRIKRKWPIEKALTINTIKTGKTKCLPI